MAKYTAARYGAYPATGEKTEAEHMLRPVDGVLEYSSEELFGNKNDRLVVIEAVDRAH
ncbi:MAG: hypothetical protein LUH20_13625 [Lachnospiraceae bacterium]|nr:hypothetical protein [Lachnospiraceae bacterium]